jgi:hypothetical protein
MHECMCACMYVFVSKVRVYSKRLCMYAWMYVYVCMCMYVCECIKTCVCRKQECLPKGMYACMYVCMYVCVCVNTLVCKKWGCLPKDMFSYTCIRAGYHFHTYIHTRRISYLAIETPQILSLNVTYIHTYIHVYAQDLIFGHWDTSDSESECHPQFKTQIIIFCQRPRDPP